MVDARRQRQWTTPVRKLNPKTAVGGARNEPKEGQCQKLWKWWGSQAEGG